MNPPTNIKILISPSETVIITRNERHPLRELVGSANIISLKKSPNNIVKNQPKPKIIYYESKQLKTEIKPRNKENVPPPNAPSSSSNMNRERIMTRLNNKFQKIGNYCEKPVEEWGYEASDRVKYFDNRTWEDNKLFPGYAMDILDYLKKREKLQMSGDFLEFQTSITRKMRSILIEWMIEIQTFCDLYHETLYLGIKLVDLYLTKRLVNRKNLQLVGITAIFIASKYNERLAPLSDELLYFCDEACTKQDLLKMEIDILRACDFNLGMPTSYGFLKRYAECSKVSESTLILAKYILESSIPNYETVTIKESVLAAASLYLAMKMKKYKDCAPILKYYTGYKLDEILSTVFWLNGILQQSKLKLRGIKTDEYSPTNIF